MYYRAGKRIHRSSTAWVGAGERRDLALVYPLEEYIDVSLMLKGKSST
jgi:hypothetical protein